MMPPKASNVNMWFFGIAIIVVLLLVSALPASAQSPCVTPSDDAQYCLVGTLTPFVPTSTPVPTVAPTQQPTDVPTIEIRPWKRFVYLPIVNK